MFWCLSFLRPPPQQATLGSSITITPQIANDLRTELKTDVPTTIHHTWSCLSGPNAGVSHDSGQLTIYDPPATTYKALTVPLPQGARAGDVWRLGLFVPPRSGPEGSLPLGEQVVGVWSEGVEVVPPSRQKGDGNGKAKGKGKAKDVGGKQTRISRSWVLQPESQDGREREALQIVEQTSFDLDKKIWDSGLAISSWLYRHLTPRDSAPEQPEVIGRICGQDGAHVVEIGAGTGIVAISLALSLARRRYPGRYSIITTDLDSAIPLIEENIALNEHLWRPTPRAEQEQTAEESQAVAEADISLRPLVLDWDREVPAEVWRDASEGCADDAGNVDTAEKDIDLVIAADVTYNTASFPSLISTLIRLLTPRHPSARAPLLLLAYKQRDVGERELWAMVEDRIRLDKVDVLHGHEGPDGEGAVEVWVGRLRTA